MTTSAILALLPKTDFQLCDVQTLLQTYKLAPISGELGSGTVGTTVNECPTAFASESNNGPWSINQILQQYGKRPWKKTIESTDELSNIITETCKEDFSYITQATINLLQHLQMGALPELTSEEKVQLCNLIDQAKTKVQQLFLANYLYARFFKKPFSIDRKNLTYDELSALRQRKFDYLSDTMPSLISTDLLDHDEDEQYKIAEAIFNNEATPKDLFEFCDTYQDRSSTLHFSFDLDTVLIYPKRYDFIFFLDKHILNKEYLISTIKKAVIEIENRVAILKSAIKGEGYVFSDDEKTAVTNMFPIAFIYEGSADSENSLLEKIEYEFRAKQNLKLGEHIQLIATDETHVDDLKSYFAKYKINVDVQSFEQCGLIKNQSNNTRPGFRR